MQLKNKNKIFMFDNQKEIEDCIANKNTRKIYCIKYSRTDIDNSTTKYLVFYINTGWGGFRADWVSFYTTEDVIPHKMYETEGCWDFAVQLTSALDICVLDFNELWKLLKSNGSTKKRSIWKFWQKIL